MEDPASQPLSPTPGPENAAAARAAIMVRRGRIPVRIAMGMVGALAIAIPLYLGIPSLAAAGGVVLLALGASLRAIDYGLDAFRTSAHLVYALALGAVAYAVFGLGLPPVITVYFPVLVLLGSAYLIGVRSAVAWTLPSVALVAAGVFLPTAPPREVEPVVTFVVRAGTLLTVLAFAISFRHSHDRQAIELQRLASTDALTGLANRVELESALDQALNRAARFERRGALVFVDIDGMKGVNDTLGHFAGDVYLQQIASRIHSVTRGIDTPARFGGDEFVVLLSEFDDPKGGEIFARKLLGVLRTPCLVEGRELVPSASIGIALFPQGRDTGEEILRRADAAMYRAKHAGGGRIFVHHPEGARELL